MTNMRTGSGDPPIPPPSIRDVEEAVRRIGGVALRTPLLRYKTMESGEPIWLKAECLQPVGSFKLRGVLNWARSLSDAELERGPDHPERRQYRPGPRIRGPPSGGSSQESLARQRAQSEG